MNHVLANNQFKGLLTLVRDNLVKENTQLKGRYESSQELQDVEMMQDAIEQSLVDLSVEQVVKDRLARIEKAMQKIEAGTYGLCEKCTHPIPFGRLHVLPEAEVCGDCLGKGR